MNGNALNVDLSSATDLLNVLPDRVGRYTIDGLDGIEWNIQKTLITNADGEVVANYG